MMMRLPIVAVAVVVAMKMAADKDAITMRADMHGAFHSSFIVFASQFMMAQWIH
uniref:Uncharacterized protein n=1 Tax=Arundo donax TaxID=35708 RepID=A0A0A9CG73_ARUDO